VDSLLQAIHHFPSVPLSQRLIVISDGHDEGSVHTENEVIAAANAAGIVVDAIGITRSNPVYLQGLQQIAAQTGGQFRQAKDSAELERLVGSGIQRLQQNAGGQFPSSESSPRRSNSPLRGPLET